jgi:hypothetical protein
MENQSEEPKIPRLARLKERLERCAASEEPGFLDADLAYAIAKEDNRNLVSEAGKLRERLAAARDRLPAEKRKDPAEIKRAYAEEIEAFLVELGVDDPKPPKPSP